MFNYLIIEVVVRVSTDGMEVTVREFALFDSGESMIGLTKQRSTWI
jgi:hypothetical protein